MAAKIPFLTTSYFTRFATKQGGAGKYTTYAPDHDTNYILLANTINQIIDEMRASTTQNNLFGFDLLKRDNADAVHPLGNNGVIGRTSYLVTINGGNANLLDVQFGVAIVNNQRVENIADLVGQFDGVAQAFDDGGGYVNLDANGVPGISNTAGDAGKMDVAEVSHNGSIYTAVVMLPGITGDHDLPAVPQPENRVMFDGDEYQEQLDRAAVFGLATKTYRSAALRIRALEQKLAGLVADDDGSLIGPIGLSPGVAATPGLVQTDGAGVEDVGTGWFRQAANVWAFAATTTERFRFGTFGIRTQNGSVGTPAIAATADTDTGIRWAAALIGLVVAGADALQILAGQVATVLGTQLAPSWSFIGDLTTGIFSPGAGRVAISSTDTLAFEVTAEAHIDSPTQPRFDFERTAVQSVTNSGALVPITFDLENTDIGAWGAVSTATLTVPTGADGFYMLVGVADFEASAVGDRAVAITLNGAGTVLPNRQGRERQPATAGADAILTATALIQLAAGDVLRFEAAHDAAGALDVVAGFTGVKVW